MKPSIGRTVHYKLPGSIRAHLKLDDTPIAAIITHVHTDTCVNLRLFIDCEAEQRLIISGGFESARSVEQGDDDGQWQWPPRVE